MASLLEHQFLRTASPGDIALYLHESAQSEKHAPESITRQLLQVIESGSLPPMVYALWTSSCPDHSATVAGLRQSHSIIVRSSAIRNFRRRFRTADCETLWNALGGTESIVQLLAEFSVIHVKEFCKAVARCSSSRHSTPKRQALVTDLLNTLASREQNPDERSLRELYAKLVYTCTTETKDAWISEYGSKNLDMAKIFETDVILHRNRCLDAARSCGHTLDSEFGRYLPLFQSVPQEPETSDRTVSVSMSFTLSVLQTLQNRGTIIEDADWLDAAIRSLLRRLVRRRASVKFTTDALDATAYCTSTRIGKRPTKHRWQRWECERLDERFLWDVIRLWQRDPTLYEPKLTTLLRACKVPLHLSNKYYNNVQTYVLSAKREQRYSLLRCILANHYQFRLDIEDSDQLRRATIDPFSEKLLLALSRTDAILLFNRYESAKPGHLKPETHGDMRALENCGEGSLGDLLRLHLLHDPEAVFSEGRERTLHSKQMAENSGSQPVRSAWINAALYFAVASRSLDLLQDTIIWARRFSRDPKTVVELYGSYPSGGKVFSDEKTISLLSGIPEDIPKHESLDILERNVHKGNEVILGLLQSAILAQGETSFNKRHWEKVFLLYQKVVAIRLRRVNALQAKRALTDNQVYLIVWQDTLRMLLKAEDLGLNQNNEALEFNDTEGPLKARRYTEKTATPLGHLSTATLRFIDELAMQRDSLWYRHRAVSNRLVTTLEPPWPRGLPIDKLWFLGRDDVPRMYDDGTKRKGMPELQGRLPFFEEKAKGVVFLEPAHALRLIPKDGPTLSAISNFQESYTFALRIYLSWCDPAERETRLQTAWRHATQALRGDRMSALECRLPVRSDLVTSPVGWNPGPRASLPGVQERQLELLVIDKLRGLRWDSPQPSLDSLSIPDFWDIKRYGSSTSNVPGSAREAFIAAALLSLDGRTQARSRLFDHPFPPLNPRFPAISLDGDLLGRETPSDDNVKQILESFLPVIPPSLLMQLANRLVEKSFEEPVPPNALRVWTSFVLRLLVLSDRPGLATDLITRVVLETPGETPWHRILLHSGILKRLPPDHASKLMLSLTDGVVQRLSQRNMFAANEDQITSPGPYIPTLSMVKVTTVKILAQILKESSFLGDELIVHALLSLFQNATHIHIRATIVDSFTQVLSCTCSPRQQDAIVNALETMVVPMAAELNERSPMSEDLWTIAERDCVPPSVHSDGDLAPICTALVKAVTQLSKLQSLRSFNLIERILLPLIRRSRENHARWTRIFLRKHGASHLASVVPDSPSKPQLLEMLLTKFTSHMPAAEFANLSDILTFEARPPQAYKDLVTKLKSHPEAYKQEDARYWIRTTDGSQFKRPRGSQEYHGIINTLKRGRFPVTEDAVKHGLVTPAHLQNHERKVLDILSTSTSSWKSWNAHKLMYEPPLKEKLSQRLCWRQYCRPIVQHAVTVVENLRTEDWQRNLYREPDALPDTFQLQLWLLPYSSIYPSSQQKQRLGEFASEVRGIVQRLASSGKPYHARWPLLKTAAKNAPERDWVKLALHLGQLQAGAERDPTIAECLRVELAVELLASAEDVLEEDVQCVRQMLQTWKHCFDEDVRSHADKGLTWLDGRVPKLSLPEEEENNDDCGSDYYSDY